MIHVVNIKDKHKYMGTTVYIGRSKVLNGPSPLGNPYSHLENTVAQFKAKDRDEAVDFYSVWLTKKLQQKDKAVVDEMNKIYKLAKQGDVTLVCHCAPLRCHGDVIKSIIDAVIKQKKEK